MSSKLEVVLSVVESGMDAFKNASKSIDDLKEGTGGLNTAMVNMAATLNVAKAAYNAVSGVVKSVVLDSINMADALQKQAKQAGVSTTLLQEYGYAAKQSGASTESMANGLTKLTENSYKAFTGNKELSSAFATLGVNLHDANGGFRDSNEIVNETIRRIADLKNPAEQTALTIQLLGKGGKDLLPMMRDGAMGIDKMRESAGKLGQVLNEDVIKRLDDTGDKLDEAKTAIKNLAAETVSSLSPAIIKLSEYGVAAVNAIGRFINYNPSEVDYYKNGIEKKIKQMDTMIERQKTLGMDITKLEKEKQDLQRELDSIGASYSNQFYGQGPTVPTSPAATVATGGTDKKSKNKPFDPTGLPSQLNIQYAKEQYDNEVKLAKDAAEEKKRINELSVGDTRNTYKSMAEVMGATYSEADVMQREAAEEEKELKAQQRQQYIANGREQLSVLTDVLKEAGAKNKAAAVAYKGIAIATTIIDTYSGAQKAFNSLASIPYVGYALGLVAAGATVAAGLLRVNEIRKQQFVSGGTSDGGLAIVGEQGRELVNLPRGSQVYNHHQTTQMINNANKSSTVLNVTIAGGHGTASQQLVTEIRSGKADYLLKQIAKGMGVA